MGASPLWKKESGLPKPKPLYSAEYRQQIIDLARAGRANPWVRPNDAEHRQLDCLRRSQFPQGKIDRQWLQNAGSPAKASPTDLFSLASRPVRYQYNTYAVVMIN